MSKLVEQRWWRWMGVGLLFSVTGAIAQTSPPTPDTLIKAIRHWSNGDVTRIAVDLTGKPAKFRTGHLPDPDRIFIDLYDVQPTPAVLMKNLPQDDGLLHNIRVAISGDGVVRIAFDLTRAAEYTATLIPDPYRLELELRAPEARGAADGPDPGLLAGAQPVSGKTAAIRKAQAPREEDSPHARQPTAASKKPADPRDTVRSLIRTLGLKIGRVVIDPGHGGDDHGTMGANGVREKDVVLDVGIRLGRLLQSLGAEVVYTRAGDYYVPLETRTTIANREQADLLVSIHANSSSDHAIRGVETYYLNFTSSPDALAVAQRENTVNQKSLGELRGLVQRIAQQEKIYESREFATTVQQALARALPNERNRGVKEAPFIVLTGASMPAILSEISFLTNSDDEHNLEDPAARQRMAEALYAGISEYIASLGGVRQPLPVKPRSTWAVDPGTWGGWTDQALDLIATHRLVLVVTCVMVAMLTFFMGSSHRPRRRLPPSPASDSTPPENGSTPKLRIIRRSSGQPLP
jgi:N-acetylmuramoyl-L-alanine amidase